MAVQVKAGGSCKPFTGSLGVRNREQLVLWKVWCVQCVIYVQLGCPCLTLGALSLKGRGEELEELELWRQQGTSRVGLQTDLFMLLNFAPNLIREELVTGACCWLRGVTCTQIYSSKMITEGKLILQSLGVPGMSQCQRGEMAAENDQFVCYKLQCLHCLISPPWWISKHVFRVMLNL